LAQATCALALVWVSFVLGCAAEGGCAAQCHFALACTGFVRPALRMRRWCQVSVLVSLSVCVNLTPYPFLPSVSQFALRKSLPASKLSCVVHVCLVLVEVVLLVCRSISMFWQ
jgi:hypothetical protein